VLVIGAGTAIVAGTGGFSGSPAPQATRLAPQTGPSFSVGHGGFPGLPCTFPGLPKKIPVTGVQISAKVTVDQVTTWWTRIPKSLYPPANTDLAVCKVDGVHGGTGEPESALGQGQLVRASLPFSGLGGGASVSGIAAGSVTSVEADLANGNVERGGLAYGAGFPYAVWWLTYPQDIGATIVFRDAAGRVVKEIAEPWPPASTFFALNPTSSVSGLVVPSATSVTAVLADGTQYSGTIVTNKLFTYPVWIVSYPLRYPATLVFRDAAGAEHAVVRDLPDCDFDVME